jgi:CheY-like chemotaxis protein
VDDDVRNIFSLTSVLESHGMKVVFAENGRARSRCSSENPDVDLVLMDVMMPEMDGYETTRAIREIGGVQGPADHRRDGQGDEGRSREDPRRGRVRLHHQAGGHRAAALADAGVAVLVSATMREPMLPRPPAGYSPELEKVEIELLLEGIFRQYGFDFRSYAYASLRRRLWKRIHAENLPTVSALQERVLHDPQVMESC